MKRRNGSTLAAGFLASMVSFMLAAPLPAQIDISKIAKTTLVLPGIDLDVKLFGGEFTEWKEEYNETDPTIVTFRATTKSTKLGVARWQVLGNPNDPASVLAEGQAGTLQAGKYIGFTVDFRPIVGSNKQRPLSYWVRLLGYENVRYGGTPPPPATSAFVRVNFVAPGPPTVFTFEGLNPELSYSMPVGARLQTLWSIGDTDIEPYLFVAVVYADGTTIVPEVDVATQRIRFTNSKVRLAGASGTHGNVLGGGDMDSGQTVPIPASTGLFEATIRPIGLQMADQYGRPESEKRKLRENTQVGIVVIGMEEDAIPSTETANELYGEFIAALQVELDNLVRGVVLDAVNPQFPDLAGAVQEIRSRLRPRLEDLAKSKTIAELEGYLAIPGAPMLATFGAVNADDYIGAGHFIVTYQQLLDAGEAGVPFNLDLSDNPDEAVAYNISGRVYVR
ncbi:MAG: hypothetical protein ACREK5_02805 [Gemmatimonadota bacterium]